MLLSPRAPLSHFTLVSHLHNLSSSSPPSHIFSILSFFFFLYLSSDSTISPLCVSHFRPNNIFFCLFHCHRLRHGAPKSLRTGLLCRGLSPSPPDGYTTGLRCDEWLTFFRAECAEPSQLLSPRESSRFLWRLELVYSAHRQHWEQLQCDQLLFRSLFWNRLCFTDGWIELVMFSTLCF